MLPGRSLPLVPADVPLPQPSCQAQLHTQRGAGTGPKPSELISARPTGQACPFPTVGKYRHLVTWQHGRSAVAGEAAYRMAAWRLGATGEGGLLRDVAGTLVPTPGGYLFDPGAADGPGSRTSRYKASLCSPSGVTHRSTGSPLPSRHRHVLSRNPPTVPTLRMGQLTPREERCLFKRSVGLGLRPLLWAACP